MSAPDLSQAVTEARAAEAQTAQVAQILAALQAQAATNSAPAAAACGCGHGHGKTSSGPSAKTVAAWLAGGTCAACVLTGMFLAIALVAVAVTVGGSVAYLLVREIRKGK